MSVLFIAIPISLALGIGFLMAFLWSVDNGQFKDLDKKAESLILDERTKNDQQQI